jgi:sugar phosphate isomerase/epimerase
MKLAFSTLGCPQWGLEKVAEVAVALGYEGLELRALDGSLDLLARPELRPGAIAATRARLADLGLSICCVDTSCSFDSADDGERRAQVEIAVRHCALAAALGAPLVRIFPDKIPAGATREATRDRIAASLGEVARRVPDGVHVGLETHGDFARGAAAAEIAGMADHRAVALIWDVANSLAAGDTVGEAARAVAPFLAHVHLRDARPVEGREHWLPVLAGSGAVPFGEAIAALEGLGYDGYVSFEWEKYWHPEIEEPEVALPDFAAAMRRALAGAGRPAGEVS